MSVGGRQATPGTWSYGLNSSCSSTCHSGLALCLKNYFSWKQIFLSQFACPPFPKIEREREREMQSFKEFISQVDFTTMTQLNTFLAGLCPCPTFFSTTSQLAAQRKLLLFSLLVVSLSFGLLFIFGLIFISSKYDLTCFK